MKNYQILKRVFKRAFLVGSGNFWYEEDEIGDDGNIIYKLYNHLLYSLFGIMTIFEIMAVLLGDFPEGERNDAISFAISHTLVMIKILSITANKSRIKDLNQKMVTVCEKYEDPEIMKRKYTVIKINIIAYVVTVFASVVCFVYEGLIKLFSGSHFVVIVTYYPAYENDSMPATATRLFTTFLLGVMMLIMIIAVDSVAVIQLIMYKYKFITLRQYFVNLGKRFEELNASGYKDLAAENLANGLIEGIQMHNSLLRMSRDLHHSFGMVIALQVCLSVGSAVPLLLQFALSTELNFIAKMKITFFIAALYFLLGVFLCNAGEITYQASLVADAIFYSGWYLCAPRVKTMQNRSIRQLVLLAMMQAQRPLVMKAFKMLPLSYGTFLSVIRGSYSVFALIVSSQDK